MHCLPTITCVFLSLVVGGIAESYLCKFIDSNGAEFDLNPLHNPTADYQIDVSGPDYPIPYTLVLNLCSRLVTTQCDSEGSDIGVCQMWPTPNFKYFAALGTFRGTEISSNDDKSSVIVTLTGDSNVAVIAFTCDPTAGIGHPTFTGKTDGYLFNFAWTSQYACPTAHHFTFPEAFSFVAEGTLPNGLSVFYDALDRNAVAVRQTGIDKRGELYVSNTVFDFKNSVIVDYKQTNSKKQCCFISIQPWATIVPFFTATANETQGECTFIGEEASVVVGNSPYLSKSSFSLGLSTDGSKLACAWEDSEELNVVSITPGVPSPSWFDYPALYATSCTQQFSFPCV